MPSLRATLLRRAAKMTPASRAVILADLALIAGRRLGRLDGDERRRLADLLLRFARDRRLSASERRELSALTAKLEPRVLVGDAVRRLSPVPVPRRLAYGRRRRPR